jgi:hypothetical protein
METSDMIEGHDYTIYSAAMFEFHREGDAWRVTGHFFDDIGRSGQVGLKQELPGIGTAA